MRPACAGQSDSPRPGGRNDCPAVGPPLASHRAGAIRQVDYGTAQVGSLAGACESVTVEVAVRHTSARGLQESPAVANQDRLTGSTARSCTSSVTRLTCTWPAAWCSRATRPTYDELRRADRFAAAPGSPLPAAARVRAARSGPAGVGRRPPFQPQLPRPPHGAAAPGRRGAAQAPRRPRVLAGARPQPAAVGAVARRGAVRRAASRARPRPTTRSSTASRGSTSHRAVRHLAGSDACRAARARVGPAAAAEPGAAARRRAARAGDGAGRDRARRPRARCGARARSPSASGARSAASPRWRGPGCSAAPASPFNVRIGPHRRFTWVHGTWPSSRRSRSPRGHRQRRRPGRGGRGARALHAAARRADRRARAAGDGARSRSAPTSSAARSATASRRCGRRCRSG